jgi:ribosomal protein S12 methylthiotransferase
VIPQFRGRFRSRRFESVVSEAAGLLARGVREINLIGQDTTSYGEDLGIKDGLARLLERLASIPAPHEKWIRFLYAYPNRVTQRLLDTIAAHEALVKYIDIPLQHASREVLRRMKRGSGGEQFLRLIERIRRTIPGVAIRTSMIVGFPGETGSDFEELCEFVRAADFDRLGVFSYSDEETSRSFLLDGKVDRRTVYHRRRRLMAIQRRISRERSRRLRGLEMPVLVEGPAAETDLLWTGRLPSQAPEIDGVCFINDDGGHPLRPGEIRRLRIDETLDYDLVGAVVDAPRASTAPAAPMFPILAGAGLSPAGREV